MGSSRFSAWRRDAAGASTRAPPLRVRSTSSPPVHARTRRIAHSRSTRRPPQPAQAGRPGHQLNAHLAAFIRSPPLSSPPPRTPAIPPSRSSEPGARRDCRAALKRSAVRLHARERVSPQPADPTRRPGITPSGQTQDAAGGARTSNASGRIDSSGPFAWALA
ncbi:hypothetical protein B0H15DRAFT_803438 [Mycena belliarum]|uniref:Uncharacterized protein n=1 Tax=Mycena belliarum TaxID=1033014 RepID=A0AAD6XJ05_9AGAR|nr:hypothetical protein B0H15DRAFT_803438 [Mycena belliae]